MTISGHMLRMAGAANKSNVPSEPGTPFGGGYYAGLISIEGQVFALVVAPKSAGGESLVNLRWKSNNTSTAGTDSRNDGWSNTQAMIAAGISNHPAAQFCVNLTIGGYTDWYLPSQDELEILYRNFKPTTQANNTNSGANPSSVPPTSNYTSGDPAQTSALLFQEGNVEAFHDSYYWSSTQFSSTYAWYQSFSNGAQLAQTNKIVTLAVRAVRRVMVS